MKPQTMHKKSFLYEDDAGRWRGLSINLFSTSYFPNYLDIPHARKSERNIDHDNIFCQMSQILLLSISCFFCIKLNWKTKLVFLYISYFDKLLYICDARFSNGPRIHIRMFKICYTKFIKNDKKYNHKTIITK